VIDSAGFASLPPAVVATDFAQDLPGGETRLIASKQGPIAVRCFDDHLTSAAWHTKPVWYVRAEQDHMIDPAAQAAMAARAGARVSNVRTSHVPMLSRPREVTEVILAAAAGHRGS